MNQLMQVNKPLTPSKGLPTLYIIIAITSLILFGSEYCYAQSKETGQIVKTNIQQNEQIAALEKRIAEAGNDFVSLTIADYDLLLSKPIGTVDGFKPLTATAGGIMVGIGFAGNGLQQVIQTVFQKIPNIEEGDVFVIFEFVKDNNGRDFLNRKKRSFGTAGEVDEIKEDESTQLTLDSRTAGSRAYWFGSRDVKMGVKSGENTFEIMSFSDMDSGTASGKVVMQLPTNITNILLAKADIGGEKPFAGAVITLKEIKADHISFKFTGNEKDIFAWQVYDSKGTMLSIKDVVIKDGIYQIYAKNPQSLKVYQSEIVRKEYPFTFVQRKTPVPAARL